VHLDTCTQRDVHVPTSYRTGLTVPVDSFMGGGRDGGSRYMHLSGLSRACVRSQVTKPAQRQRDLAKAWVQRILASDSTLVPATELGQERKVLGRHWVIVTNGKSFVSASCLLDNVTVSILLNLSSHPQLSFTSAEALPMVLE